MPYMKKLQLSFMIIIVFSSTLLIYNQYNLQQFKKNSLSKDIMYELRQKEILILKKIQKHYNINAKVPIIISKKMGNKLYGLAGIDKQKNIHIYLNKKMFFESKDYMIHYVLAHEYAHVLMFLFGNISEENGGHTKQWVEICKNIGGVKCERFVDSYDIVISKRNIF